MLYHEIVGQGKVYIIVVLTNAGLSVLLASVFLLLVIIELVQTQNKSKFS